MTRAPSKLASQRKIAVFVALEKLADAFAYAGINPPIFAMDRKEIARLRAIGADLRLVQCGAHTPTIYRLDRVRIVETYARHQGFLVQLRYQSPHNRTTQPDA